MAKTKPDKLLSLFEELAEKMNINIVQGKGCLLYTSPSPRD